VKKWKVEVEDMHRYIDSILLNSCSSDFSHSSSKVGRFDGKYSCRFARSNRALMRRLYDALVRPRHALAAWNSLATTTER